METANQIANVLLPFCHKIAEGLSKRKPLGYVHNAVVFIFHLNADTGASLLFVPLSEAEYFQLCNALAHLNPSANSNRIELVPYHC